MDKEKSAFLKFPALIQRGLQLTSGGRRRTNPVNSADKSGHTDLRNAVKLSVACDRNCPKHVEFYSKNKFKKLTLILQTWRIWWAPNNASKWQMGFNSVFKGLMHPVGFIIIIYHDARSPERQKCKSYVQNHGKPKSVGAGTVSGLWQEDGRQERANIPVHKFSVIAVRTGPTETGKLVTLRNTQTNAYQ